MLWNVRALDHVRPAIDLRAHEAVELLAGGRGGRYHELGQACRHVRRAQDRGDIGVQLVEERHGHGGRRAYAVPRIDLVAEHARFLHGRHVRQLRLALRARDRERAQPSALGERDDEWKIRDVDRKLAGDDVHRPLGRVLVGDAHDVEFQPLLEPFHRELRRGADQPGGVAQLARVGPRVRGQILDRLERRRGVRGDDVGRHADARDRREIALLVGHLLEQ